MTVPAALLIDSDHRLVGRPLLAPGISEADRTGGLYEVAPSGVRAHNTDAGPRFVYPDRMAQRCFEYGWDEFLALPSRLSADLHAQAERRRLPDAVTMDGRASGVRGPRVTRSGRRCSIEGGGWSGSSSMPAARCAGRRRSFRIGGMPGFVHLPSETSARKHHPGRARSNDRQEGRPTVSVFVPAQIFVPPSAVGAQSLAASATFGIAFFACPIGSFTFGHCGNRIGRKSTLVGSLLSMGIRTMLIGALPGYNGVGVSTPVLLCLLRLDQGIGLGGEWGGAGAGAP